MEAACLKKGRTLMPIGIIFNSFAIVIGGLLGALMGDRLSDSFKDKLNMIFGLSSMGMGIASIVLMENMPAVIFSLILGTSLGILIHLEQWITAGAGLMQKAISHFLKPGSSSMGQEEYTATLLTIIVLFCASGTGIYGSIVSGMTGDHSILIAKSILDLFTSLIFACLLGVVVSLIAIPQFLIFLMMFLLAGVIFPLTTPSMVNDFKACGGFLMVATGFRIIRTRMFPTADMIPAMILVMPLSWLWQNYIAPLVSG